MKTVEEARRRWETLSSYGKSTDDLRQAVKSEEHSNPCEDGLRSIFWKAFLLCDNLDQPEWIYRLSDTRSAYEALKDHFLKYIKHPDDLESTVDPLTEDDESPWQALRRDEGIRAEIYQDIERCLQENYFFREPSTKSMMLDILFIYSKLNPDLGYRQGMHELLAPVLWVVERDAVHLESSAKLHTDGNDGDFMLQMLDVKYVEHDSFSIFCSIMQVARSFYEHSDDKVVNGHAEIAPIVRLCQHIHNELLLTADHELASHLSTIEILPQIFLTRWIRLLFGREFSFEDTLLMWDVIFANGLRVTLIEQICVAMLLRIRWQLLQSDYSSALTLLLRYPPIQDHGSQTLVHDGLFLEQNSNPARGAYLISKYSGRPPELGNQPLQQRLKGISSKRDNFRSHSRNESQESSPGRSPARNNQRSLETLFQDVSEGLQRRTENWGVAKAVRGAVTEARRNMANAEPGGIPSLRPWHSSPRFGTRTLGQPRNPTTVDSTKRASFEGKGDPGLTQLLKDALDDLSAVKEAEASFEPRVAEALQSAYEKIQTAQVKARALQTHATIEPTKEAKSSLEQKEADQVEEKQKGEAALLASSPKEDQIRTEVFNTRVQVQGVVNEPVIVATAEPPSAAPLSSRPVASASATRPPLADSEFSWMLGENTHRSHFVSSASLPPDQRRHSESRTRQSPLFGDARDQTRGGTAGEEDGLPLSSLT